jgi:hypothetical protein
MSHELEKLPWLNKPEQPRHWTMSDVIKLVVFGAAAVMLLAGALAG